MKQLTQEWHRGDYTVSTNPRKLNLDVIHEFLSRDSYWAKNRSRSLVERSLEHSLNFGIYRADRQIGFARVVTDYATFAWLADVFIIEEYRGQALGKWLIETVISFEPLQGLRRWILATRDAHELYRKFGFSVVDQPDQWMEKREPS